LEDHLRGRVGKLREHLQTGAAGRGRHIGARDDGDGGDLRVTSGNRGGDRGPLRADRETVRRILDIATGMDGTALRENRGPHLELRVWRIRSFPRVRRSFDEPSDLSGSGLSRCHLKGS
jgi:hypothetical protein